MTTTIERYRSDWAYPAFEVYIDAQFVALVTMRPPEHVARYRRPAGELPWHIWMQPIRGETWRDVNGSASYVGERLNLADAVRDVEYLVDRQAGP